MLIMDVWGDALKLLAKNLRLGNSLINCFSLHEIKKFTYYLFTLNTKSMTNQQESRLSMYLSFRDYQAGFTAITSTLPNYTTNSTTFVNTITQIQTVAEQQKISKKGVTDNKNNLKESLIVTTADYARKLGVFAKFTNNATLLKR